MGVYHLAGVGRSIGAITAAFSYQAALKEKGGEAAEHMFGRSGGHDREDNSGYAIQALVLFTTPEIYNQTEEGYCDPYLENLPGDKKKGPTGTSGKVREILKRHLSKEIRPLARPSQAKVDLYWCEIDRSDPVKTFERVVQVLRCCKPSGKIGREVWINLTGGTNIINSALQLGASLTGTAARQYYVLTDNIECIRHTVHRNDLGTEQDRFWVEVPTIYLESSKLQREVLELIALTPEERYLPGQIRDLCKAHLPDSSDEMLDRDLIRPLRSQRLLEGDRETGYRIGPAWERLRKYHDCVSLMDKSPVQLSELDWVHQESLNLRP